MDRRDDLTRRLGLVVEEHPDAVALRSWHERAREFLRALDAPSVAGQVVNVATGQRISLNELLLVMNRVLGTNLSAIYEAPRVGDVMDSQADISKAREVLSYSPTTSFEEGLRHTIAWCRAEATSLSGSTSP